MTASWFPGAGRSPRAKSRLFCFPHAGGGAALFGAWSRHLPDSVEVASCHLPGRDERFHEPAFTRLDPLLDALEEAIAPLLDRPFAVFGHSLGGWVAFYLARRLRRSGRPLPARLIVSSCRAPHLPPRHGPIHELPRARFLAALQERYDAIPALILGEPDLLDRFLAPLRADFALMETITYRADEPLPCPIAARHGDRDPLVGAGDVQPWAQHTGAAFSMRALPGDHFYLRPARASMLWRMLADLDLVATGAPGP